MTSKEFVIWLKGFMEACHEYAPTPKQWDTIKEELEKVSDEFKPMGVAIGSGGFGTTATPGYCSISFNPSTLTTYGYPSGSVWHYTNNNPHNQDK